MSSLPSKPGFVIAAVVVVLVGAWYYGSSYSTCRDLTRDRAALSAAIDEVGEGGTLDLAQALPGDWDEVRIVQDYHLNAGEKTLHCPFGWGLTSDERHGLIESGRYVVIGLFSKGAFQRYAEASGEDVRFEGDVAEVPRAAAIFDVLPPDGGVQVLTLAGGG